MSAHGLNVCFYNAPQHSPGKSEGAGRPIYDDKEMVNIRFPGDKNSEIHRVASDEDKKKYAEEYQAYKAGVMGDDQSSGTPLSQWPAMPRSVVEEWKFLKVATVEQLALLSDSGKQAFGMGANEWSEKAKAWLAAAAGGAEAARFATENLALRREMETMRQQFAELNARVEADAKAREPGKVRPEGNRVHKVLEPLS